jgi:hypothetical protein
VEFGFSEASVAPIGRECFVRFHKGPNTVSIAWEPGGNPIVDLFYPAGANDKITPWAARGAIQYSRRTPRIAVGRPYDAVDLEAATAHLRESLKQLTEEERPFLERSDAV